MSLSWMGLLRLSVWNFSPLMRARIFSSSSLAWTVADLGLALPEVLADLVLDVLLEAADEQALDLVLGVVARVGHGRRFEHVHQVGEALGLAVVRRGAGQDQRVAGPGQQRGEPAPLGVGVGDVVALVDDDHVPVALLQVGPVAAVVLERVDADDGPVEVVERVLVRRDLGPHPLEALGVEADQRDGEPGPEFLLELGQDAS